MANGILSKPPAKQAQKGRRISPGVYAPVKTKKPAQPKQQAYQGLNKAQKGLVQNLEQADTALGNTANQQLGAIDQSFQQPFDWNQLPQTPWSQGQDLQGLTQKYQDEVYNNFARNAEPQFKKQQEDFEQQMANRGIPVGSDLYNKQRKELLDTQEGQRANMRTGALQESTQYGTAWNDLGTQNYQNAYTQATQKRYQPLTDYNQLRAATSPAAMGNLQFSQNKNLQNQADAQARWMMQNTPRGGGGDPGLGGYAGTGMSYQDYLAAKNASEMQLMAYQGKQAKKSQPNPYMQLGGQIGGSLLSGWAQSGFPGLLD